MNTWQFIYNKLIASVDVMLIYVLESKGSYLLEVMVGKENNVFPMVPQGRGVAEIVLSKEEI